MNMVRDIILNLTLVSLANRCKSKRAFMAKEHTNNHKTTHDQSKFMLIILVTRRWTMNVNRSIPGNNMQQQSRACSWVTSRCRNSSAKTSWLRSISSSASRKSNLVRMRKSHTRKSPSDLTATMNGLEGRFYKC